MSYLGNAHKGNMWICFSLNIQLKFDLHRVGDSPIMYNVFSNIPVVPASAPYTFPKDIDSKF